MNEILNDAPPVMNQYYNDHCNSLPPIDPKLKKIKKYKVSLSDGTVKFLTIEEIVKSIDESIMDEIFKEINYNKTGYNDGSDFLTLSEINYIKEEYDKRGIIPTKDWNYDKKNKTVKDIMYLYEGGEYFMDGRLPLESYGCHPPLD